MALGLAVALAACTELDPSPRAVAPSSPKATTAPSPPPSSPPPERGFTIAATGDLLPHEPVVSAAARAAAGTGYDFKPLLAEVRPVLSKADLAVCHLETTLSPDSRNLSYYPNFRSPRELAVAVRWAGFDACTTASNHILDFGPAGVRHTLDALDAAGVKHVGAARTAAEAARPHLYSIQGFRVAHLDYTYGLNGRNVPSSQPWLVPLIDRARILREAHAVRAAGAQFVIVGLHWGQEHQSTPTVGQRTLARQLLASPDIDLLLGSHAHVVQPVDRINGKFVVYGMGNFLARHADCCATPQTSDGVIVNIAVRETAGRLVVSRVTYVPTLVDRTTLGIIPLADRLRSGRTSPSRQFLLASWARTVNRMNLLGADKYGVAPEDAPPGAPTR